MTHLLRAPSGKYFYRRMVPAALRAAIGKREIKIALNTTDPEEAKRRHSQAHRQACELIRRYQGGTGATPQPGTINVGPASDTLPELRLSPQQINALVCRWRANAVAQAQFHFAFGQPLTEGRRLEEVRKSRAMAASYRQYAIDRTYPDHILRLARRALDEAGLGAVPSDSEEFPLVCYAVSLAFADWMEAEAEWRAGNTKHFPTGPVLALPPAMDSDPAPLAQRLSATPTRHEYSQAQPSGGVHFQNAPRGNTPFSEVVERWFREKAGMTEKTKHECRMILRRLGEVLGSDVSIGSIDSAKVAEWKEALCMMPRCLPDADRRLPILEIAKKYEGQELQRISNATVCKQIGLLQSFFGWAKHHRYVLENHAEGLKPDKPKRGMRPRIPFTSDDLRAIFISPVYAGCESPRERLKPGTHIIRDEYFWLPLLAVFQGGRLDELGSLLLSEIKTEEGILFLELDVLETGGDAAEKDEKMKSYTSLRVSPVHPVVMACGFAGYVEELKRRGETRLFPNFKPDRFGTFTAQYSKWFGRFLTALGITERRKVFHSFRHNFKAACRKANLREDVHDRLTGHRNESVGRQYGEDMPMCVLAEAMAKIQYPELDLSRLYTAEPKNG